MFDHLDKLRAKPVHVRERIALIATATLSFLVGSVWWITWNAGNTTSPSALLEISSPSPFHVVSDILGRMKEQTMAALAEAGNQLRRQTEGSIEYAQSKEIGTGGNASEDVADGAIVFSATPPNVPEEMTMDDAKRGDTLGEAIHTRPKPISGNDVAR